MNKKRRLKNIIKSTLYFLFYYLRFFDLLLKILTKIRQQHPCIILLYHRIVDDQSIYLDKGPVVHHHIYHFKKEIHYLKKNYQILSMDEVVHCMKSGLGFRKPSVAITFDDGCLDNYTFAHPVLKKSGVPANIYIVTSLIGTSERPWTYQIELAFLRTKKSYFSFPYLLDEEKVRIRTRAEKKRAFAQVVESLKRKPDGERKELMQKLLEILNVGDIYKKKEKSRMMLNWNEVKKMAQNGITFGAHTHTHPILSRMPLQEAKEDILYSKKVIEENLGTKVRHFAFPNGRDQDFSEELRDYCREIGFKSVASVNYGLNDSKIDSAMRLKRIGATSPVWMMAGDLTREVARWYRRHA